MYCGGVYWGLVYRLTQAHFIKVVASIAEISELLLLVRIKARRRSADGGEGEKGGGGGGGGGEGEGKGIGDSLAEGGVGATADETMVGGSLRAATRTATRASGAAASPMAAAAVGLRRLLQQEVVCVRVRVRHVRSHPPAPTPTPTPTHEFTWARGYAENAVAGPAREIRVDGSGRGSHQAHRGLAFSV